MIAETPGVRASASNGRDALTKQAENKNEKEQTVMKTYIVAIQGGESVGNT